MRSPYIDIHCHLLSGLPDVTALQSLDAAAYAEAEELPRYSSVGVHPWEAGKADIERALRNMRRYAEQDTCIAFGEAGFDRLRGPSLALQEEVLIRQLQLAEELKLPMILHNVRCTSELLRLRKEFSATPWILHGFSGNADTAAQCLVKDMHFSFGPAMLTHTDRLADVIGTVSIERVFCESDDTDVAIQEIYAAVGQVTGLSPRDLRERLKQNFIQVFGVQP